MNNKEKILNAVVATNQWDIPLKICRNLSPVLSNKSVLRGVQLRVRRMSYFHMESLAFFKQEALNEYVLDDSSSQRFATFGEVKKKKKLKRRLMGIMNSAHYEFCFFSLAGT